MNDTDAVWLVEQLRKRHPTLKDKINMSLSSASPGFDVNGKHVVVPYEKLLNEVDSRKHYYGLDRECDLLWTMLTYIEMQAGLKSPYE